jgi:tetratricopeptide (TPR) repeat protein
MRSHKAFKKIFPLIFLLAAVTGCSSLVETTRKSLLGDDKPRTKKAKAQWVTKEQYDQLMVKYKNLLSEYEKVKEQKLTGSGPDIIGELNNQPNADESVDVFGKNGIASSALANKPSISRPMTEDELNKEIKVYKKGVSFKANGNTAEAIKIFQVLEKSQTKQIRVRSRYHLASLYFSQNQYDLALQVTEKMIGYDAFSGVVLEAMVIAVKCCDKLGLEEKKLKYNSMLKDVFGQS